MRSLAMSAVVADLYGLAAMNAVRPQEQVRAFKPLRLFLRIDVAAHARLERELTTRLGISDSQRGVRKQSVRLIDELCRRPRVERGVVVRFRFERDVGNRFPGGMTRRG